MQRLAVVAGEISGDSIGAQALERLLQLRPGLELEGIGGPQLRALGLESWADSEQLAVRGYVEALSQIRTILRIRKTLIQRLEGAPPSLFLGLDAPDFNLTVERRMRQIGVPTAHLVCPSIWAWRPERLQSIVEAVDTMLCLFPFEPALFDGQRTRAVYVGHPMADRIPLERSPEAARSRLGASTTDPRPLLAILPGSRLSEIRQLGSAFLTTAMKLGRDFQTWIPAASSKVEAAIRALPEWRAAESAGVRLLPPHASGQSARDILEAADLALVASGTATLEAALYRLPMVIAYRVPPLTAWMMRRRALVKFVGLPNLLLGRPLVPERLQDACHPAELVRSLRELADDQHLQSEMRQAFEGLHNTLRRGTAARTAEVLADMLPPRSA